MNAVTPSIGTLSDRVQIFRKDMSTTIDGGHTTIFVPLATVWARVHARPGGLGISADARAVQATHSVVMRFRTDLSVGDRFVYRSRALEVLSAEDLNGHKAYLSCACIETSIAG